MPGAPRQFSSFLMKQKGVFFSFFIYFSVAKSQTSCLHSDLFVCFQILVPHGLVFNMLCGYLCMCARLCVCVCVSMCVCAHIYMSVTVDVVVVGTSCEVSCVIFCLVVGYGGRLNALAVHGDAILCSVVSQPPLPCLSLPRLITRADKQVWVSVCRAILRILRGLRLFQRAK